MILFVRFLIRFSRPDPHIVLIQFCELIRPPAVILAHAKNALHVKSRHPRRGFPRPGPERRRCLQL